MSDLFRHCSIIFSIRQLTLSSGVLVRSHLIGRSRRWIHRIEFLFAVMRALLLSVMVRSWAEKFSLYWSVWIPTFSFSHEIGILIERSRFWQNQLKWWSFIFGGISQLLRWFGHLFWTLPVQNLLGWGL